MNEEISNSTERSQGLHTFQCTAGKMADEVRKRPELVGRLANVVASARTLTSTPIVKRAHRYEDIGRDRTHLDGRAKFMDGQPRQEWFGLAMSDCGTNNALLSELPLLAFAYRCTGEEVFRRRIIVQLEEAATWSPLQRPGWQLHTPSPDPVPDDYWDGSWLATGTGVRALADTLELLRAEIETITQDWKLKRGWFRGGNGVPQTNQWVLPTEGLIRACLVLGKRDYVEAYELGVANLLRAFDVQGQAGEFNEGIGYAKITVSSMLAAAHAMAVQGDSRAIEHPFMRGFPDWAVQHLQPGRYRVNCFDAGGARTLRSDVAARQLLESLAVFAQSPTAAWALWNLYDGPTDSLVGLLAHTLARPDEVPPTFAFYHGPARRVNWRSSWADTADGVWVRGGHPLDSHDHYDRGHVNYIVRGKPLLIEAGTPSYDNPSIHTLYSTVVGHNVLEIEGLKPKKAVAPIDVTRLDASGGELTVDATACYPGLKQWQRRVTWDQCEMVVEDRVAAPAEQPVAMLFRWHLGTDEPIKISGEGGNWQVMWPDGMLVLTSSVQVSVSREDLPDQTVCLGAKENGWDFTHACVMVRCLQSTSNAEFKTTIRAID